MGHTESEELTGCSGTDLMVRPIFEGYLGEEILESVGHQIPVDIRCKKYKLIGSW